MALSVCCVYDSIMAPSRRSIHYSSASSVRGWMRSATFSMKHHQLHLFAGGDVADARAVSIVATLRALCSTGHAIAARAKHIHAAFRLCHRLDEWAGRTRGAAPPYRCGSTQRSAWRAKERAVRWRLGKHQHRKRRQREPVDKSGSERRKRAKKMAAAHPKKMKLISLKMWPSAAKAGGGWRRSRNGGNRRPLARRRNVGNGLSWRCGRWRGGILAAQ